MKYVLTLLALLVLVMSVFAQAKPKQRTTIKCAIMPAMTVNIAKATKDKMFADHKGRRYFFCCAGCVSTFRSNPDRFKNAESIPTPKK